ncbi:DUF2784 domain-containing protein [Nonomuraea cavernae]|uniref:DUF2784 domain-containing protein n=1 Tax=Nonomuraea cavernae TaxID=2045107 RepID=A0A918DMD9_9ACTN|nr:DUF2784 domain-containing protein [Nonomuraea cavernae]MCA2189009.1 DUF2784 domain-containing protein [Nonomuraea cavernae]GGO75287.1 hypothetical protein GCM10012289_49930 [Nonomuraea cavernae]
MMYRLIADAAMVVHFAFLAYLALGGFIAWRWRRTIWTHLAVVGWGLISIVTGVDCPLTYVEDWARRQAGLEGLPPTGFIDHYLEGVVYPEAYTNVARLAVAVVVLFSYVGYVLRRQ